MSLDLIQLGARVRDIRKSAGLTQPELGAKLGISAVAISQVEKGKTAPALAKVAAIADALGVSPAVLFGDPIATAEHILAEVRARVRELGYDIALFPIAPARAVTEGTDPPMTTTADPTDSVSQRVHALIFNGITAASADATREDDWIRLSERERIAQAVLGELRAGNIEFRLGPLALLAEAVEAEARPAEPQIRAADIAAEGTET